MRILIDTNIIIPLEDSDVPLSITLAELYRIYIDNHIELLIHSLVLEDIERDQNEDRKRKILSQLKKYKILESAPQLKESEEELLFGVPKRDNDRVDNRLLYSLYKNAVSFLITEDIGIHKKAERIGLNDRVLYIQQALVKINKLFNVIPIQLPFVEEVFLHQLDLSDKIFISLRENYNNFDSWFKSAAEKGRKAWIYQAKDELGAMIIYKEEHDPIVTSNNIGIPGKVLKLCSFIVCETFRGNKIGELLIKQSFFYAEENSYSAIYITIRQSTNIILINMLLDFGFEKLGEAIIDNSGIDDIYVKSQNPKSEYIELNNFEFSKKYYPKVKVSAKTQGFLVPIQPKYHEILFPEAQKQNVLFREMHKAGNAIKQAYLCKSNTKQIQKGDYLIFYRSNDWKEITTICIVEKVFRSSDYTEILENVLKRTVYTNEELIQISKSETLIILFRIQGHFPSFINNNKLIQKGILKGPLQSIKRIGYNELGEIINESRFKYCITSN